jgi:hypothetical protein
MRRSSVSIPVWYMKKIRGRNINSASLSDLEIAWEMIESFFLPHPHCLWLLVQVSFVPAEVNISPCALLTASLKLPPGKKNPINTLMIRDFAVISATACVWDCRENIAITLWI